MKKNRLRPDYIYIEPNRWNTVACLCNIDDSPALQSFVSPYWLGTREHSSRYHIFVGASTTFFYKLR